MVGWLAEEERQGRRTVLERTGLAGLTVLRAGVPLPPKLRERTVLRRVEKAAGLLARAGVRRVLTRQDFPHWDVLSAYVRWTWSPCVRLWRRPWLWRRWSGGGLHLPLERWRCPGGG